MSDFNIDPSGPLAYLLEKPAIPVPDNKLGKDAFLKLLVAQMKYQNPMEPSSSTEFISQTAQFTLVEQMENMSRSNADMLAGQLSATAASLVGKAVKWDPGLTDDNESPGMGVVEGVRITVDGPILVVGDWEVPLARVTEFGDVPDAPAPPAVDETGGTDQTGETDQTDQTDQTGETEAPPADPPITESEPEPDPDAAPTAA